MNNQKNQKAYPKKESALRRFFRLPPLLRIEDDKPVLYKQQFAVMGTVLVICCALFLCVYLFLNFSGLFPEKNDSSEQEKSGVSLNEKDGSKESSVQQSSAEPKKIITKISAANKAILKNMTMVTKNNEEVFNGPLILVNKTYPSRLNGENVELLLDHMTDDYILSDYTVSFANDMIDPFNQMMSDFAKEYGETDIMVSCGYRSLETQTQLLREEQYYSEPDDENEGETGEQWVARPGYSEHQTGYAFDFDLNLKEGGKIGINYDGQGEYSWLNKNCSEYGFIVRYIEGKENITGYNYEPWHFRYVGLPHAQYMEDHKITLEEYLDIVRKHTGDDAILMEDHDGTFWCIYYVPADDGETTEIAVPEDYEYYISGDNMVKEDSENNYDDEANEDSSSYNNGGFIVTVKIGDHVEEISEQPSVQSSNDESSSQSSESAASDAESQPVSSEAESSADVQPSQQEQISVADEPSQESEPEQSRDITVISIPEDESSENEYYFDPLQGV